ncbi:MAG: hypothetical protein QM630_09990 [Microbacterium sp.]
MTTTHRHPDDVAIWRDAIREASTLENLRPDDGLIRQIRLSPDTLEFTLVGGEVFTVPASADRNVIASAASKALGRSVIANQAAEWEPPAQTVNFWWAETLYNFGMLAPEGIVMEPTVVFTRIWRDGTVAKIEAYDADRTAIAEFDLGADHPPVDTVTDVLEALRA